VTRALDSIPEARVFAREARRAGRRIGFVPTMGALHEGHLELVRAAARETDCVVVSIFVNPLQFAPDEDFERYPRDLEADRSRLAALGVDAVFCTTPAEMYPEGFRTHIEQGGLFQKLEGVARPHFFRGVTTVVTKLFHIVTPDVAFFGQKDAQQCILIHRMVVDLDFDLTLRVVPTRREPDGLAMSSRNAYLDGEDRQRATVLYRALRRAAAGFARGERRSSELFRAMDEELATVPEFEIDYRAIVDLGSLDPVEVVRDRALAAVAGRLGSTRLIDNWILGGEGRPDAGILGRVFQIDSAGRGP